MLLIVFHIVLAFLAMWLAGCGMAGLLSLWMGGPNRIPGRGYVAPAVGYAVSQLIFYWSYAATGDSLISFQTSLFIPGFLTLCYFLVRAKQRRFKVRLSKEKVFVFLWLSLALAFAIWPYLLIGEGHYYHSGNIDAFNRTDLGRELLLNRDINAIKWIPNFPTRLTLQYSPQVFWTLLLHTPNPMDAFMIQHALNLLMTMMGVFWLLRYPFGMPLWISTGGGVAMTVSNFYFTTFLSGNIGSMMYGAIVPFFLGTAILWINFHKAHLEKTPRPALKSILFSWAKQRYSPPPLILLALLFWFVVQAYYNAIYFIMIPLAAYALYELALSPLAIPERIKPYIQDPKRRMALSASAIFLLILSAALIYWTADVFEPLRLRAMSRERTAWELGASWLIMPVFWGLSPSDVAGTARIMFFPPLFSPALIAVSFVCFGISLYGAFLLFRRGWTFFAFYAFFWLLFLIMMKYFYGSGYYLYKFYCVNFFLFPPCFLAGIHGILKKKTLLSRLACPAVALILALNLGYSFVGQKRIFDQEYHDTKEMPGVISQLKKYEDYSVKADFLDETRLYRNQVITGDTLILRKIFQYNELKFLRDDENSDYVLRINKKIDVTDKSHENGRKVWKNRLFSIYESQNRNNLILKNFYQPESAPQGPVRWIADHHIPESEYLTGHLKAAMEKAPKEMLAQSYFNIYRFHYNMALKKILDQTDMRVEWDRKKARHEFKSLSGMRRKESLWQAENYRIIENRLQRIKKALLKEHLDPLLSILKENSEIPVFIDMPKDDDIRRSLSENRDLSLAANPDDATFFIRYAEPPHRYLPVKNQRILFRTSELYGIVLELAELPHENRVEPPPSTLLPFERYIKGLRLDPSFIVQLKNADSFFKHIQIVIAPGYGIDMRPFSLVAEDLDGNRLGEYGVKGVTFISHPIGDMPLENTFVFRGDGLKGKFLPHDRRKLDMKLMFAGLSRSPSPSARALETLNAFKGKN